MTPSSRRSRLAAPFLLTALVLTGCSSGGDEDAASAGGAVDERAVADRAVTGARTAREPAAEAPRAVISTGTVELRASDVGDARFEVQQVLDRFRGEVAEQQSDTDGKGVLVHARLVVRIPSADFDEAVAALEEVGDLVFSETRAEDVTTQVIDTRVELRVQRRSIARVETLLDRARSIRDIVAIEAQLARRQARLGSLEQTAAYLADQTAMSTVTVSLERRRHHPATDDAGGFLTGLRAGWDGLGAVAVVLTTTLGAVLPFAVVLLVLLVPGWPVYRVLRRRRRASTPAPL
jgi:hypothetical protein